MRLESEEEEEGITHHGCGAAGTPSGLRSLFLLPWGSAAFRSDGSQADLLRVAAARSGPGRPGRRGHW